MIISYRYQGVSDPWSFARTDFGPLNLLVGESGAGKTRFLNSIFNIAMTISKGEPFRVGIWEITLQIESILYEWRYSGLKTSEHPHGLIEETLRSRSTDGDEWNSIVERTVGEFHFESGPKLPKLQANVSALTLFKEEKWVEPLYKLFSSIHRRKFDSSGLENVTMIESIPKAMLETYRDDPSLDRLSTEEHTLSAQLFILKSYFNPIYENVKSEFKRVFPSIEDFDVHPDVNPPIKLGDDGIVPLLQIKEQGIEPWIPLAGLSSGMQKVLLIIADVLGYKENSIYFIDEYENSLGVNAINFLPSFLAEHGGGMQFFITTHHPYLISNIPIRNWRIFKRLGSKVMITKGEDVEDRYGESSQDVFLQLLNDPLYRSEL